MQDLQEYAVGPTQLDRTLNVLRGTTMIRAHSVNGGPGGRRYSERALRQIAAMAEGLSAYANHVAPDLAFKARDIRDLIGKHRNVRFDASRQAVVSDLHILEHQAPFVFSLAQGLGDVVGNSLVSRGAVRREGDTEIVDEIVAVRSADLVSDPATTRGLFESRGETEKKTLTEILEGSDVHERLQCAVTGERYDPPAWRGGVDRFVNAYLNGMPIKDALTLMEEGR